MEQALREHHPAFLERLAPLLPAAHERFTGDLLDLDRGPLYRQLAQLCRLYAESSPEERAYLRSRVDARLDSQLESFGLRAAVAGAREHDPESVRLGLTAFAVADLGRDVRDVPLSMPVLLRCAELAGAPPKALFQEAAALAGPAMAAVLIDFAARPPGLQTPGAMGWHEVQTPAGPGFRSGARRNPTAP